jgi:hypothetical protein
MFYRTNKTDFVQTFFFLFFLGIDFLHICLEPIKLNDEFPSQHYRIGARIELSLNSERWMIVVHNELLDTLVPDHGCSHVIQYQYVSHWAYRRIIIIFARI